MKKCITCLVLAFVLLCLSVNFASSDSMPPYFIIDNILKMSGGNDAVYIKPFDYTNREFDPAEEQPGYENEFNHTVTILAQNWSDKPAKNSRPTSKNGLLNSGSPVEITAYGNKAVFSQYGGDGFDTVRIHDDKGKVLFEANGESKEYVFELDSMPKTFYVSFEAKRTLYSHTPSIGIGPFSIPMGNGIKAQKSEYCYVQLRMEAGREKRTYAGSPKAKDDALNMAKNQILVWSVMKQHNIASPDDITRKLSEKQISDTMMGYARKDPNDFSIARSIAENYLRDHNITSMYDLKESDFKAMSEEYLTRLNAKGNKEPVRKAPAKKKRK